jgi:murein DD-endopeptidase MepM/ murein hydrolase activator NlpD
MRVQKTLALVVCCLCLAGLHSARAAGARPWQKRVAQNVDARRVAAHRNTPIELWPKEPDFPNDIEPSRFEEALSNLCGPMPAERLRGYRNAILDASSQYSIDPFLLAALVYDQSRCWPMTYKRDQARGLFGLTRLPVDMHAPHVRKGKYTYFIWKGNGWQARELAMPGIPLNRYRASDTQDGLFLSAAILRVLEIQHRDLDARFEQTPHRHFVSHWFYGDVVRETEPETRVLTARRRLLEHYARTTYPPLGKIGDVDLHLPLDGRPRLVVDYFGNTRGKKDRGYWHRGMDLDAVEGEPVRAMAAGRISFAGTDLPGGNSGGHLTPAEAVSLVESKQKLGPGGLYVHVNHAGTVGSIYMHLETIAVRTGDLVAAGQIIGTSGRTGTDVSGPHLHLELRVGTDRVDPAQILGPALVNPFGHGTEAPDN